MQDIQYALRTLRKNPGFAATAILTLALGIGANTAIFSVVNGVLLRPLPFADPAGLVKVWTETADERRSNHSAGDFLDLQRENQSLAAIAGYRSAPFSAAARPGEPVQLGGAYVTASFFDILGVRPAHGRVFSAALDERAGEPLTVLSYASARQLYGAPDRAAGQRLRVNGRPHTVVGVLPPHAEWPEPSQLWVLADKPVPPSPVAMQDAKIDPLTDREVRYFEAIGRLKPGVTLERAQVDVSRVALALQQRATRSGPRRDVRLGLLSEQIVGDVRFALLVLQGAVGLVLLIACANVSSLLLARSTGRRRELAVRAALGADRRRLIRQLLTESLLLGAIGGAAGLLVGAWLTVLLLNVLPDSIPRADGIGLDRVVAVSTLLVALVTGVLFGVAPALQASSSETGTTLKVAGDRGSGVRARARAALVVAEIALTLVLLAGAGLLLNSLLRLQRVESGLRPENVTLVGLSLPEWRYPSSTSQADVYRRLLEGLTRRGDIAAAGIGFPGPLRGNNASGSFYIEGRPPDPENRPFANLGSVSGGYFSAMGIPLVEGRTFTDSDVSDAPGVGIVSQAFARKYWPGERAVGRRLRFDESTDGPWMTIVGVVGDVRQLGLHAEPPPLLFIPYPQFTLPFSDVVIRSTSPAPAVASLVRSQLAAIDPDLPPGDVRTLDTVLSNSVDEPRFRTALLSSFAILALVLAAVGVYGLLSYSVTQRTREIGIRIALGARPSQVLIPMMREGVTLGVTGIAIGLAGALLSARVLASFLFGIDATDPMTFAAVALLLLAVAAIATYIPARRALRVDAIAALRVE